MRRKLILMQQTTASVFTDLFDEYIPHAAFDFDDADENTFIHFGGGTDVSPKYYHEPLGKYSSDPDNLRDATELHLVSSLSKVIGGFIGICRGAQLLTVANGGKLFQHVSHHAIEGTHNIVTKDGNYIKVTSTHHQMMNPFNLPRANYQILAKTPTRISDVYMNGWDSTLPAPECEPEVVWYPETRSLAVQGHPEYMQNHEPFPLYFRELIKTRLFD